MVAAGLLARNAVARGLKSAPHVKTSLAPGSRVVTDYLAAAGLQEPLDTLGFQLVGYGCTTCIGNSGPLSDEISQAVRDDELAVCAVLSGNRNFEGRIHPLVRASYLASPPLVVAYALAGSISIDLEHEPLGTDGDGADVYLRDLWPSSSEVRAAIEASVTPELFEREYATIWDGDERWRALPAPEGALFDWAPDSTYVREPSFFQDLQPEPEPLTDIDGARCLVVLGDSVTTDHISPAGAIPRDMPAGRYLLEHAVEPRDFNSFGARRGNHEVMVRGTFGNIRLRNALADGREGSYTAHLPSGEQLTIFEAAERYRAENVPLVALVGKEYGSGSSRDWAAKGTLLLGVRAVIAESFERIHRSNLAGMGVLPLVYEAGENAESLGLTGEETVDITGIAGELTPRQKIAVTATRPDGARVSFKAVLRLDTPVEVGYYRNGGILQTVLRALAGTA
jgi:aconitate hydratase